MSEDLIGAYLARLRAKLRAAHEAAIAAFGPVRAVVRAHRRPSAVLAEAGMAAWRLAALCMLFAGTAAAAVPMAWNGHIGQYGMAGMAAAFLITLGYTVLMGRTLLRQGRGGRASEELTPYAG